MLKNKILHLCGIYADMPQNIHIEVGDHRVYRSRKYFVFEMRRINARGYLQGYIAITISEIGEISYDVMSPNTIYKDANCLIDFFTTYPHDIMESIRKKPIEKIPDFFKL